MNKLCVFALFLLATFSSQATWLTDTVKQVSVKYGNGCVLLDGGEVIKIDLATDAGKAEFSLALTAFTAKKRIQVKQSEETLTEGCNTGTTIKPHSMMNLIE